MRPSAVRIGLAGIRRSSMRFKDDVPHSCIPPSIQLSLLAEFGLTPAPHAGEGELVQRRDLLQVREHLERQVAQQAGRHVGGGACARPFPCHQPCERRHDLHEGPQRLHTKTQ